MMHRWSDDGLANRDVICQPLAFYSKGQRSLLYACIDFLYRFLEIKMTEPLFPEWALVLDWDETLCCPCECKQHVRTDGTLVDPDYYSVINKRFMYLRPGVRDFLTWAFENFGSCDLWSHGNEMYINEVVYQLKSLQVLPASRSFGRVFHGEHALKLSDPETFQPKWFKPLALQNYPLHRTLIVDDRAENATFNPDSAIVVPEYRPCTPHAVDDTALSTIQEYLVQHLPHAPSPGHLPSREELFLTNCTDASV